MSEDPATESELQRSLSVYERELASINEKLRDARREARDESIAAAACRQGVPSEKIKHWQDSIARLQSEALATQQRIGQTNKAIRALRSSANHQRNRRERDREVREGLFLSCFFVIVRDSVDPRQFKAFEEGAHKLAAEHETMFGQEGAS